MCTENYFWKFIKRKENRLFKAQLKLKYNNIKNILFM